jgi:hypothetical protein
MLRYVPVLLLLVTHPLAAQEGAHPMARLGHMVGRWEGEWTRTVGPGQRQTGRIVETVQAKQAGRVLVVEGLGREGEGGANDRVIHDALGFITWDAAAGRYAMRAFRDGVPVDAVLEVHGDAVVWGFDDARAGRIRFTANITADRWHEVGELSRDGGATWMPFMETTLRRVADGSAGGAHRHAPQ